jgi:uncharacterized protein with PIN domain
VVDKSLAKVGKMLRENGITCVIVDSDDKYAACAQAIKENKIFLTNNLKAFNKKLSVPAGCLHYKASPFRKFFYP